VAEAALYAVKRLTAFHDGGIGGRALRIGAHESAAATTAAAAGWYLHRRLRQDLRDSGDRDCYKNLSGGSLHKIAILTWDQDSFGI
jgi:hypothetical protein